MHETDPARADGGGPAAGTAPPGAAPVPDAGRREPVTGTGTGLQREVGRMADGRRITYYWARGAGS